MHDDNTDSARFLDRIPISGCKQEPTPFSPLSPVSRLSADLLSYVIYLSSAQEGGFAHIPRRILENTARFTAQVNRQWRALSLRNNLIWLGPVLNWYSPHKWISEVLRRSDPLPLDVVIPLDAATRCPLIVAMALLHLSRIRVLDLTLVSNAWWFIAHSKQLKTRAPLLEKFSLEVKPGIEGDRRLYIPQPSNMFGGHAPRLQQFRILNYSVDLAQPVFGGLRVLEMEETQYGAGVPDMLRTLGQMKYLESLRIVLPLETGVARDTYMPQSYFCDIHMLNLTEFMVSASLSTCAGLLRSLILPESCAIVLDVHYQGKSQEIDDLSVITSRLGAVLKNWTCEPLTGQQSLRIGFDEVGFSIEGPDEDTSLSSWNHPSLSLTFWWSDGAHQAAMLLNFLSFVTSLFGQCRQAPYTLSILATTQIPLELYPDLRNRLISWLKGMKDLQAIEFRDHEAFAIMEKLLNGPRLDILLPNLGDMTLVEVNLTTQRRRYWRRLLKILKFRASREVDAPILQLDFVRCLGELRKENLLGRFGTVVTINGRECSDDDDDEEEASDYTVQELSD